MAMFAGIQATLHNKWYEKTGGGRFGPADFMPRRDEPVTAKSALDQRIEDQKLMIWGALSFASQAAGVN